MPGPLSFWEIIIILLVLLLLFGAKRLPEMGRSLGRGMREFKDAVTGKDDEPAQLNPPAAPAAKATEPAAQPKSDSA
jgi:sec-independent protein translocase protein TatA